MSSHRISKSSHRSQSSRRRSIQRKSQYRSRSPNESRAHDQILSLPFQASQISKHDYPSYKPMFELYLEIQKRINFEDLSEIEVKGRWKSFIGKWNRGELAEGWYEPTTLQKARASATSAKHLAASPSYKHESFNQGYDNDNDDVDDTNDAVGPALPAEGLTSLDVGRRSGPAIPNFQDLELHREMGREDSLVERSNLHHARALDRKSQKEQLDELLPKSDPGSKARLLEKKREAAASNRAFASAKTDAGGSIMDVPDADLLGDDNGGIDGFRKKKADAERKKNEREIRREEVLRARRLEREDRVRVHQAKEEKTMSGLVALAKARFG